MFEALMDEPRTKGRELFYLSGQRAHKLWTRDGLNSEERTLKRKLSPYLNDLPKAFIIGCEPDAEAGEMTYLISRAGFWASESYRTFARTVLAELDADFKTCDEATLDRVQSDLLRRYGRAGNVITEFEVAAEKLLSFLSITFEEYFEGSIIDI
jgi:hypothetical protein